MECTASGSTEVADFIPIIIIIACVVALLLAYCVCFRKHVAKRIKGRDMKTTTQRASTKYLEKRDKIVALRTILKESMTKLKIMTGNMQVLQSHSAASLAGAPTLGSIALHTALALTLALS